MINDVRKLEHDPLVVILFCEQALGAEVWGADEIRTNHGIKVRLLPMPCSSKVEINHLVKLLEQGATGIEVIGCPPSICHLLGGSQKAKSRVEYVCERLRQLGLGPKRVHMTQAVGLSRQQLFDLAVLRVQAIESPDDDSRPVSK